MLPEAAPWCRDSSHDEAAKAAPYGQMTEAPPDTLNSVDPAGLGLIMVTAIGPLAARYTPAPVGAVWKVTFSRAVPDGPSNRLTLSCGTVDGVFVNVTFLKSRIC